MLPCRRTCRAVPETEGMCGASDHSEASLAKRDGIVIPGRPRCVEGAVAMFRNSSLLGSSDELAVALGVDLRHSRRDCCGLSTLRMEPKRCVRRHLGWGRTCLRQI